MSSSFLEEKNCELPGSYTCANMMICQVELTNYNLSMIQRAVRGEDDKSHDLNMASEKIKQTGSNFQIVVWLYEKCATKCQVLQFFAGIDVATPIRRQDKPIRTPRTIGRLISSNDRRRHWCASSCGRFPLSIITSENYTSIYMSLNIKRHIYVSYTTYNLCKKIKQHIVFLIWHIILFKIKQHIIVLYNI